MIKKIKIFLILFLVFKNISFSQVNISCSKVLDPESNCYGYVDTSGNFIIPPIYQDAFEFYNGYAIVSNYERYGIIDLKGDQIIPIEYDVINNFYNKRTIAKKNNSWFVINENNQILDTLKYHDIKPFKVGNCFITPYRINNLWGILDTNLNVITPPKYYNINCFSEGYSIFEFGNFMGVIDGFGKEIVRPIYQSISKFVNGKAFFSRDTLYGFLDMNGNECCLFKQSEYGMPGEFNDTLILIEEKDNYRFKLLNSNCNFIFQDFHSLNELYDIYYDTLFYNYNQKFFNGLAKIRSIQFTSDLLVEINQKKGIFDKFGNEIIPCKYDEISLQSITERIYVVRIKEKYGLYVQNRICIPVSYESIESYGSIYSIRLNHKRGFLNSKFELIIPIIDIGYEEPKDNILCIKTENSGKKYVQYYKINGELLNNISYEEGYTFNEGKACVKKDGKWGYIDYNGNIVIPFIYDTVTNFESSRAIIMKNSLYGIINEKGIPITEIKYDYISSFQEGFAVVSVDGKYGLMNFNGEEITRIIYEYIFGFFNGLCELKFKNTEIFLDSDGMIFNVNCK